MFLLIHLFFILLFLQLPSIPPQVLGSTPSAPTASAPTLAATNGGAIVALTNPNEFLQHLLRSSPHVTVNCNMPGSNVTTYAGSHTVNNMMEGHQDLKDFFENTINRLVHQGIQVTGPNSNDTDRDTISRRLLEVLERQTGPTGDASTGLNGDDSTGNTKEDASLQRHKELLTRLNDVLAAIESQAQPNGPFMECIRTAVKSQTSMRRNHLDSPRAWVPDISLDTITELGSLERLSVPTATLLFQDAKGRTICLEPCGTQIRFTNYGGKNAIFTLPVGTVQESSGGTTAKLLPDGNIEYSFGVTALVPVSATERKIWCKKCAKGTACDHHQIP